MTTKKSTSPLAKIDITSPIAGPYSGWTHLGAADLHLLHRLVAKRYENDTWDMATRYALRAGLITSGQYEWLRAREEAAY